MAGNRGDHLRNHGFLWCAGVWLTNTASLAAELLRGPVPSDSGLAIGLYHVARHAEACGYAPALAHNTDGKVSFVLSGPVTPAADAAARSV